MIRFLTFVLPAIASLPLQAGQLKVTVIDKSSGEPISARVELRAADGTFHHDRVGMRLKDWPYIEAHGAFFRGTKTFEMPEGRARIRAAHGVQYKVASQEIDIPKDGEVAITISLERQPNLLLKGWVAGDAHMHMIHGSRQYETSYEEIATICEAGGMDWGYVNQGYIGAGELDLAGYHEECRRVSTDDFKLMLGAERPKSLLGHNCLIGVENPFIVADDPPYYQAAREVHRQGGVLYYVHPVRYFNGKMWKGRWLNFPGNNLSRELLFDAFAGPSFDALSVLSDQPGKDLGHRLWFNLLNKGFWVPIMADADTVFDKPTTHRATPGFWLSYLYIGEDVEVTGNNLAEAIRQGRTIATTGPLLEFKIDDQMPGTTIPLDGKARTLSIQATHYFNPWTLDTIDQGSEKPVGISKVELIKNGEVVQKWQPNATTFDQVLKLEETEPCWYTVRVYGTNANWQTAMSSPIYFGHEKKTNKKHPKQIIVKGRIYDFKTGRPAEGTVIVKKGKEILNSFSATDQFAVRIPLDATVAVEASGFETIEHEWVLGHGPVHQFLWNLESEDFGEMETLNQFEELLDPIELEFPIGYKMTGSYLAKDLDSPMSFDRVKVLSGPEKSEKGTIAIAGLLCDTREIAPGDSINVAVIFCDESRHSTPVPEMRLVCVARGYDPSRPSGYNPLKELGSIEENWSDAEDAGNGYRIIRGSITVPEWVEPGPLKSISLDLRARKFPMDGGFVGTLIPVAENTRRGLTVTTTWPTMPTSWHDHTYGIGFTKVCGKAGYEGQPTSDYREMVLQVTSGDTEFQLSPSKDTAGCADADDAFYDGQFFDQVLQEQSRIGSGRPTAHPLEQKDRRKFILRKSIREQPKVEWKSDLKVN